MATGRLQRRKQADAASLMGVSAWTLHDRGKVPRNEDETDGAIEWVAGTK